MAHCLYKTGDFSKAAELYEAADTFYERPENIHLIHMRLGFYYIDVGDYQRARRIFLRACKYPPTCKTWLGIGISCYHVSLEWYSIKIIRYSLLGLFNWKCVAWKIRGLWARSYRSQSNRRRGSRSLGLFMPTEYGLAQISWI